MNSIADQVLCIAIVRSPYQFLTSSIQQIIKSGTRSYNLEEMSSEKFFPSNIPRCKRLKQCFDSECVFIPFTAACAHENGPVAYFLDKIGVAETNKIKYHRRNESISNIILRLQNSLNAIEPSITDSKLNSNFINVLDKGNDIGDKSGKFLLTKSEASKIEDFLIKENDETRKLLGEDFCDEKYAYSKELSSYDILSIAAKLLHNKKQETLAVGKEAPVVL